MSLIKTKSIAFNVEDLQQKELLEWASMQRKVGFSEYVKDLIARDMKARKASHMNASHVNASTQK